MRLTSVFVFVVVVLCYAILAYSVGHRTGFRDGQQDIIRKTHALKTP
jgi:hypothetical protein